MSGILKSAFWATVAGQIILLLAFIAIKENTLRTGTSVLLQTAPVDPRSLFQGDYAILAYEIADLPPRMEGSPLGTKLYVDLYEDPDSVWRAGSYLYERPSSDRVFIKGTVISRNRLEFGIDTFFVPEGTGRIIERSRDVKVLVSINSSGTAVIDDLIVDGLPFDPRSESQPQTLAVDDRRPPPPGQSRPLTGKEIPTGVDEFEIEAVGDELRFSTAVMLALPDVEIVVNFNNSSLVNSHNLVIVQSGTKDVVAAAGITAGLANDWIPVGDNDVFASTSLLAPGAIGEVRFLAPQPGGYQFVCTFPGHASTMFGDFIVLDRP